MDHWARPLVCLLNHKCVLPWVCVSYSKTPFYMVSKLEKEFISFPCFSFSTTPLCPGNIVVWGDMEKGSFVLPTSHGASYPIGHTVGGVFHLLVTSKKVGKWSSQTRRWRLWTPTTPAWTLALTTCCWTWSPCIGTLESITSSRVFG